MKSERSKADIFKSLLELNLESRSGPVPPDFEGETGEHSNDANEGHQPHREVQ